MSREAWSEEELRALKHNEHERAFIAYLRSEAHTADKQEFLTSWIAPTDDDYIVEYGSSSGKTCVDLARRSGCRTLGIDFDPSAIEVSTRMRDQWFPGLRSRCEFRQDDVTAIRLDPDVTKIAMADFTEHIPDAVFHQLLENIRRQLPAVRVYIYTPDRRHVFEILKHRNILLHRPEGHINVKSAIALRGFLEQRGWSILDQRWRPSHHAGFRVLESALGRAPVVGNFFRRRIALIAAPGPQTP